MLFGKPHVKVAQEGVPRDPRDLQGLHRHCGGSLHRIIWGLV